MRQLCFLAVLLVVAGLETAEALPGGKSWTAMLKAKTEILKAAAPAPAPAPASAPAPKKAAAPAPKKAAAPTKAAAAPKKSVEGHAGSPKTLPTEGSSVGNSGGHWGYTPLNGPKTWRKLYSDCAGTFHHSDNGSWASEVFRRLKWSPIFLVR